MHFHSHENPALTEGRLIRWASSYDFLTNILTFGQANRLRNLTIDQALLKLMKIFSMWTAVQEE